MAGEGMSSLQKVNYTLFRIRIGIFSKINVLHMIQKVKKNKVNIVV